MSSETRLVDAAVVVAAVAIDLVVWNGDRELRSGVALGLLTIPLAVIGVHLSLWWRRTATLTVFAVQWGFAVVASMIVPQFQPFAGLLVALYTVGARLPAAVSVSLLVAAVVPLAIHSYNAAISAGDGSPLDVAQMLVLWMGLAAAGWGVGRFSFVSLQRATRLREQRAAEAVAAERTRLARELHDTISHAVTTMMIQAAGGRAQLDRDPRRAAAALEVIERSGRDAMTELHRLLGLLDGQPTPDPRVADIVKLVALAQVTGRRIGVSETGTSVALHPDAEVAAYRIVQESLTNSMKYAGPQAAVFVGLQWSPAGLDIDVTDRPSGPALSDTQLAALSSGSGLAGLRARVESLGGALSAGAADGGFTISARLPRHDPSAADTSGSPS